VQLGNFIIIDNGQTDLGGFDSGGIEGGSHQPLQIGHPYWQQFLPIAAVDLPSPGGPWHRMAGRSATLSLSH
jgi:hypothetical protein